MICNSFTSRACQVSFKSDDSLFLHQPFVPSKAYATRKTIAQGALDIALLMANASQLKALIDIPANNRGNFYAVLLALLGVSIVLQVLLVQI